MQQTEFKSFEKDLKSYEKGCLGNQGPKPAAILPENSELRSKFDQVKTKYQNLMSLSNLYSQRYTFTTHSV